MIPNRQPPNTARPDASSLTRRDALKAGATLLGGLAVAKTFAAAPRPKKIIIVGGGLAGLCCAYELMDRGHDVTVLEASRRTGGHVKTIRAPLPDGLYADVGAEHFTKPGYTEYWKYVKKFDLTALPWNRRQAMYRQIDGQWLTEEQLADPAVLTRFGFNAREVDYMVQHGWTERLSLYFEPQFARFTDEYQPFGVGVDELDRVTFADWLADQGASAGMIRFCGNPRRASAEKPPASTDVSALYRIWTAAVSKLRGLPTFKRDVYHLKGGNQVLPDIFAAKLGGRVRRNRPVSAVEHDGSSVTVHFEETGRKQKLTADYLVFCITPQMVSAIDVKPAWSEAKRFTLLHTVMGMQSRVILQTKSAFWKGDVPSINLETGNSNMSYVYETAAEVPGERRVLMGSGKPVQNAEEALAAFRKFYPGKNPDTIEQCIVHQWWKEEPTCFGCERQAFPLGQLAKFWPHLLEPVGRIHFAGAGYDNQTWGQDAATRSANRVARAIHAA
jgi:monoamine oxidase